MKQGRVIVHTRSLQLRTMGNVKQGKTIASHNWSYNVNNG
ncbi:hypothetical protein KSS87_018465 [Heliosperma pusillum]|nr:hypothetical protein KSS87_018465 [Heliosperma pusillum]